MTFMAVFRLRVGRDIYDLTFLANEHEDSVGVKLIIREFQKTAVTYVYEKNP